MPMGIVFYVVLLIWFVLGYALNTENFRTHGYGLLGGNLDLFVLLLLLGWRVFGPPIQ